jgi:hypothetical protein
VDVEAQDWVPGAWNTEIRKIVAPGTCAEFGLQCWSKFQEKIKIQFHRREKYRSNLIFNIFWKNKNNTKFPQMWSLSLGSDFLITTRVSTRRFRPPLTPCQGLPYRSGQPNRRPSVTVNRPVSRGYRSLSNKFKFSNPRPVQSVRHRFTDRFGPVTDRLGR